MSHKINIKKADGSFLVLDINTSINSVFRPSDNKSLKDILTDEYAPKNNPVFTGSISLGRKEGTTVGENSFAVGDNTTASGTSSHAEGNSTTASVNNSHAEGSSTTASGINSHAEGNYTKASSYSSHAEGDSTEASGTSSHAEGSSTTASGKSSHAEGIITTASGDYSHAEGSDTIASGTSSHAEGSSTKASSENQHVQGKYNIEDTAKKYAHIVGNGTSGLKRSNAHTLDWEGNAWYSGKLSQEGTPTEDKDLTTKNYVDTKVASIVDSSPETLDTLKELSNALGDDANFATTVTTNIGKKVDKPAVEGTEGQVLSKSADGSNVWVDLSIEENNLNTMLTNVFGFVSKN